MTNVVDPIISSSISFPRYYNNYIATKQMIVASRILIILSSLIIFSITAAKRNFRKMTLLTLMTDRTGSSEEAASALSRSVRVRDLC